MDDETEKIYYINLNNDDYYFYKLNIDIYDKNY